MYLNCVKINTVKHHSSLVKVFTLLGFSIVGMIARVCETLVYHR